MREWNAVPAGADSTCVDTRSDNEQTRRHPEDAMGALAIYSTWCYILRVKRVLKTKAFARWCKRKLSDETLCSAACEIQSGRYEADLGKGVIKKRVAYPGKGKSGGARLLVAQRMRGFIIFLVGRDKSDPGSDFTKEQGDAAKELVLAYEKLDSAQLELLMNSGELKEICNDGLKSAKP